MINGTIVKTILINEFKWKVKKLPKLVNSALVSFLFFYFFIEDEFKFLVGFTSVVISYVFSLSSVLPSSNKNLICNNFSWNYYLTLTKDIDSLLLGTYVTGFVLKIPLILSSAYMLYSYDMLSSDITLIAITLCSCAVIMDSYKLRYGIYLSKKVTTSFEIDNFKDYILPFLVNRLDVFNFIISLATGTIIFNSLYKISHIYGILFALIVFIIINIYFYKRLISTINKDPSSLREFKVSLKAFFVILAVIVVTAIIAVLFKI